MMGKKKNKIARHVAAGDGQVLHKINAPRASGIASKKEAKDGAQTIHATNTGSQLSMKALKHALGIKRKAKAQGFKLALNRNDHN
jgi:hypothetical protein